MSARSRASARALAAFRSGLQCFVNSDQGRWIMADGSQERVWARISRMSTRLGRLGGVVTCQLLVLTGAANAQVGLAPSNQAAFDELVDGKQWQDTEDPTSAIVFIAPGRFSVPALPEEAREGDYRYENTGADTGIFTLTWDATDNDPDVLRAVVELAFASTTTGAFDFTLYTFGSVEERISGTFEIVDAARPVPALPPLALLLLAFMLFVAGWRLRHRQGVARSSEVCS